MTRLHAARVAARLRRELKVEVEVVGAPYGRFEVVLDGQAVVEGGALAVLGVLPSAQKVIEVVRAKLDGPQPG